MKTYCRQYHSVFAVDDLYPLVSQYFERVQPAFHYLPGQLV
jgi:hypothetical protein